MKLKTYLISPYLVGSNNTSTAVVLPSKVVKTLKIDSTSTFLMLKVYSDDELNLKIIREKDLIKEDEKSAASIAVEKFPRPIMQQKKDLSS